MHILHLLHEHRQMTITEFIEKYNSDNFDSYIKENATIDYWNDLIKTYKIEKLNFASNESLALTCNIELLENRDLFFGVRFDGFCERQIEILKIKEQYKPQQVEAVKPEKTLLEFKEFLNRYEKEALQIDLRAEFPLVYDILERHKMKLNSASFDSDIDEVIVFCKKAVKETKENINTSIINEHYNCYYKNGKPPFLLQLKLYYEYLELYKLAIVKTNQPQQTNTIKTEIETKNILTNDTYYNILENCTIEAFESLKLKELYPKNGTKAIWDISSLTITKGDGLPTEKDNDLFRKEYILDNMRVTFLMALDRFSKDFEIKHSITRDIFYKKCYQSILLKTSQSSLWQEPDFGFDINAEPCNLTFIWNMRTDIEERSKEYQQPEIPQKNKEIEQYLQSYKHSYFSSVIDKQNNNKQDNILFYGKVTADVLEQRNKYLLSNEILKERSSLLSDYNKHLYYLTGHTMQLFKAVNDYSKTSDNSFLTKINIKEDDVFSSLSEIKDIVKDIKHNIINDENHIAQKIKDYSILMFDDCVDLLNKRFGVDIYKSPLKTHFENVKQELKDSINYAELKIINELSKNSLEASRQTNTNNTDELKKEHPIHNPNDWNTDCFELFKYLFDEYYNEKKRTKTKLMCIWFYLSEYNPEKYNLKITKDDYIVLIKKNYGIKITNRDKPDNYESKVLGTLHEHRIKFEVSLK